ncbi:MAG: hypothetical protein MJZ79_00575 [Paludibacteraceae bacterium]|nr:hypothetical protein [Candidatus Colicola equi]MCQ2339267.1 hypothetical protein [Paludibacteraceae bacterium]
MENIIIPQGNTNEEVKAREQVIYQFYKQWKLANPTQRKYNLSLKDYINIRQISIIETAEHAAKTYLSTLAVLQLDAILTNAQKVAVVRTKIRSRNQNQFEKMIVMGYQCVGIGAIKMIVGIKRSNKEKVQYCITHLDVDDLLYTDFCHAIQTKK